MSSATLESPVAIKPSVLGAVAELLAELHSDASTESRAGLAEALDFALLDVPKGCWIEAEIIQLRDGQLSRVETRKAIVALLRRVVADTGFPVKERAGYEREADRCDNKANWYLDFDESPIETEYVYVAPPMMTAAGFLSWLTWMQAESRWMLRPYLAHEVVKVDDAIPDDWQPMLGRVDAAIEAARTHGDLYDAFHKLMVAFVGEFFPDAEAKVEELLKLVNGPNAACSRDDRRIVPHLKGEPVETKVAAAEELMEPIQENFPPGPFPMECVDNAPGFLGDVIRYDLATSMYPQPILALAGALAQVSVMTGRRVKSATNLRTNLFIVALSPSGGGKSFARDILKKTLTAGGASKLIGNERIGSHAGIQAALVESAALVMPIDEIGDFFGCLKAGGKKDGQTRSIEPLLKAIYSAAGDENFIGDAYADVDRKREICQPHLVIHGVCPPDDYWSSITDSNIKGGLVARFLVLDSAAHVMPRRGVRAGPVPAHLATWVAKWKAFEPGGLLNQEQPEPPEIRFDKDADDELWNHIEAIAKRRMTEDDRTAAIWSRCGEKATKLAMIAACARTLDPGAEEITVSLADVQWAKKIAIWSTRLMTYQAAEVCAENEEETRKKDLLKMIPKFPARISRSEITNRTKRMKAAQRASSLSDLVAGGSVKEDKEKTPGPPRFWYSKF